MKKLTITITEQNGNRKNITVELENELADWLITQPEDVQCDFILFEYKARCVERKETRRTQSLNSSLDNGFDIADESADDAEDILTRLAVGQAIERLNPRQQWIVKQLYYIGRSQAEVARELGISKPAVTQQIAVIKSTLKIFLKNFEDQP